MLRRANVLWLLTYFAVIAAVVTGLVVARRRTLADTPAAREKWRVWKERTNQQPKTSDPVQRRVVSSDEPPTLILLRDRFPVVVATMVLICSFLFGFLVFLVKGVVRSGRPTS